MLAVYDVKKSFQGVSAGNEMNLIKGAIQKSHIFIVLDKLLKDFG